MKKDADFVYKIECFKWHYQRTNERRKYKQKKNKSNDKGTLHNVKKSPV